MDKFEEDWKCDGEALVNTFKFKDVFFLVNETGINFCFKEKHIFFCEMMKTSLDINFS